MWNKIQVVDYILQSFWILSYNNIEVLHNNLQLEHSEPIFSEIPIPHLLLPMMYGRIHLYQRKHVEPNTSSGLHSTAILDVILP